MEEQEPRAPEGTKIIKLEEEGIYRVDDDKLEFRWIKWLKKCKMFRLVKKQD